MINAVALFCEDIRQDSIGAHILTGVLPDGISLPSVPTHLPKIGVFTRINVALDFPPQMITVRISGGGFPQPMINNISSEIVQQSQQQASEQGAPYAGLVTAMMASPLPVPEPGRLVVDLQFGEQTMIIGFLNLLGPDAISH